MPESILDFLQLRVLPLEPRGIVHGLVEGGDEHLLLLHGALELQLPSQRHT